MGRGDPLTPIQAGGILQPPVAAGHVDALRKDGYRGRLRKGGGLALASCPIGAYVFIGRRLLTCSTMSLAGLVGVTFAAGWPVAEVARVAVAGALLLGHLATLAHLVQALADGSAARVGLAARAPTTLLVAGVCLWTCGPVATTLALLSLPLGGVFAAVVGALQGSDLRSTVGGWSPPARPATGQVPC